MTTCFCSLLLKLFYSEIFNLLSPTKRNKGRVLYSRYSIYELTDKEIERRLKRVYKKTD